MAVFRALDDPWGTAWALVDFGWALRQDGDRLQAQALTDEALTEVRRSGDVWLLIQVLTALGGLVLEGGEVERAESLAHEGLVLLRDSGVRWCLPECLELAAGVGGSRGRSEAAARLFGAAEAIREMTGADRFIGRAAYPSFVRMVRSSLDDRTFDAAWSEGRRRSVEQAIDEALLDRAAAVADHPGWAEADRPALAGCAHRARARGGGAPRPRPQQRSDRRDAGGGQGNRRHPRAPHPGEAGLLLAGPGGRLGGLARLAGPELSFQSGQVPIGEDTQRRSIDL